MMVFSVIGFSGFSRFSGSKMLVFQLVLLSLGLPSKDKMKSVSATYDADYFVSSEIELSKRNGMRSWLVSLSTGTGEPQTYRNFKR